MKWTKIDNDSYGTILTSWCICAVLIFLTARYIPILWVSIPLCAFMVYSWCSSPGFSAYRTA